MNVRKLIICGASSLAIASQAANAQTSDADTARAAASAETDTFGANEIIVTAQKREENINNVGISIAAASGDRLQELGVSNTADLQKLVPGFVATPTYYGTSVFTIRGVGFQDSSLAGSPTVSVYVDEVPLPFSSLTRGATLDLQRVEVLKGPQGTVFGQNATGGAVNYVANKPTDSLEAGGEVTYGRFSDLRFNGFVSGPLTDTLGARLAVQVQNSGAWQKGYGPQAGQKMGGTDFANFRASLNWEPSADLRVLGTLSGWRDKSYNQAGQYVGFAELSPLAPLAPAIINYPVAPGDNRAAGWNQCVNTSGFNPIAGQEFGAQWLTPNGRLQSMGPGSVAQAGGQPTECVPSRNDNDFLAGSLRVDYDLSDSVTVTSLTSYQHFNREAGIDASGMPLQVYQSYQLGDIKSFYQEFRVAGDFGGRGSWLVGLNYGNDKTFDSFLQSFGASSAAPTLFVYDFSPEAYATLAGGSPNAPGPLVGVGPNGLNLLAYPLVTSRPTNAQDNDTYAIYSSGEFPITDTITLLGGIRYTSITQRAGVCNRDSGDGNLANLAFALQGLLGSTSPRLAAAGTCAALGRPEDNFNSPADGSNFQLRRKEDNIAWRAGVNWQFEPNKLLYVSLSKGYKGGAYPTVSQTVYAQGLGVTQESLLSYEAGFKLGLFDRQLQLNGAAFYYDYKDKQIIGALADLVFGALPALVNVPQSHVKGFELSAIFTPRFLDGLTIAPSVSYQKSSVDSSSRNVCDQGALNARGNGSTCIAGDYYNFDFFGQYANFTDEPFPNAPRWQALVDTEYHWSASSDLNFFVGATLQYTSSTNGGFVNRSPNQPVGPLAPNKPHDDLFIKGYTLLDLRAGVEKGPWRFQVWGRNVTNTYYYTSSVYVNDNLIRYTGLPVTYGVTAGIKF